MRRSITLALMLLACTACSGDGPTGSSGLTGVFDLQTIDGMAPPRVELVNMSLDTLFTTGGELRVLTRGRMSVVKKKRWVSSNMGPLPEDPDTAIVTFRQSGSELYLEYPSTVPYGPYTDTATVSADAVTVRTKIFGLQLGTVFVRQYRYVPR